MVSKAQSDRIYVESIRGSALIGIYPHERRRRQPVLVTLEFPCDAARAAARDRMEDAVDYDVLTKETIRFARKSSYFLIETLADRLAAHLLSVSRIPWIRLSLVKPKALASARSVRIEIFRKRNS